MWQVLNDPAQMAKTMPGVESFDIKDERHWRANVKVPLGLGGLKMSIDFEKTEEREPDHARLHAKGNGVGAILSMDTAFDLSEAGGGTHMRWEADVRIAGPVGSMGQRVLQPIVNQQVASVLAALERQVQEAAAGGASSGAPVGMVADPTTGQQTPPVESGGGGTAGGATEARTEGVSAETDPELKDYGEPANVPPEADAGAGQEGTSGAEEGLTPWDEEAYSPDPQGPSREGDR